MTNAKPLTLGALLTTRAFRVSTLAMAVLSLILAMLPLTHTLGFEYAMLMGLGSTVILTHFVLASLRQFPEKSGPDSFTGGMVRLLGASALALLPALGIILLNALRVRNCNLTEGLLFFLLNSGVGVFWAAAVGAVLATLPWKKVSSALVYLLPTLSVGLAVWTGLFQPPIFAYDPFFGFFPGTLYDEVRTITSTLVLYRLLVLTGALWWLTTVYLFAGANTFWGRNTFAWHHSPLFQDSSLSAPHRLERVVGAVTVWLVTGTLLMVGYKDRHTIGFQHNRASIARALGGRLETANFTLIYDREAFSPRQIQLLARDHEYRYHQLTKFFGVRPRKKVTSFLFRDPAQKSRYMGAARTMIARPWAYEMYLHGTSFPHPVLKHELVHVFSAEFGVGPLKMSVSYGVLFHAAMVEGVAVAADGSRRGLSPHQWCRAMLNLGTKPSPAKILNPAGFFRQSSLMAYKIAGSFSRYLIDTYGIEKYKRVYGRANFAGVYGRSLTSLGEEWRRWLRKNVTLNDYDQDLAAYYFRRYRSIFSRVCPHEVAALRKKSATLQAAGQFFAAIEVQQELCKISPRSYHQLQLARLSLKAKKFEKASQLLHALSTSPRLKKRRILRRQIAFLKSSLLFQQGKHEQSRRVLLSLQRERLSLAWRRLLWMRLKATARGKRGAAMLAYLASHSDRRATLRFLSSALKAPKDPLAAYLLGRRFLLAGDFNLARKHLRKAYKYFTVVVFPLEKQGEPHTATSRPSPPQKGMNPLFDRQGKQAILFEIERLLSMVHYNTGNYRRASNLFLRVSKRPLPSGEKRIAKDWSQRSLWEQTVYGKPVSDKPN